MRKVKEPHVKSKHQKAIKDAVLKIRKESLKTLEDIIEYPDSYFDKVTNFNTKHPEK